MSTNKFNPSSCGAICVGCAPGPPEATGAGSLEKRIDHGAPFPLERKRPDMVDLLLLVVGPSA